MLPVLVLLAPQHTKWARCLECNSVKGVRTFIQGRMIAAEVFVILGNMPRDAGNPEYAASDPIPPST